MQDCFKEIRLPGICLGAFFYDIQQGVYITAAITNNFIPDRKPLT